MQIEELVSAQRAFFNTGATKDAAFRRRALAALRQAVTCGIVASGGVSTLEDIRRLRALGIDEAIAGKAVYSGALDLAAAIREAK